MDDFNKLFDYQEQPFQEIVKNAKTAEPNKTVFFGDSLFEFYDLKNFFPIQTYYNCGIRGATSELLLHLHPYCIKDYQPDKVVILIGTNDLDDMYQYGRLDIVTNLYNLVTILNERYQIKEIVVVSPLPIIEAKKGTIKRTNTQLQMLGNEICNAITEFDNARYINVYEDFLLNNELAPAYTSDGLHLNEAGYKQMTKLLMEKL